MPSLDNYLAVHANAISLRSQRAEILSSNLANADTPGYRAQDLDFASVLKHAGNSGKTTMSATHSAHFGAQEMNVDRQTYFRDAPEKSLDENTVDSEYERAQFADNAVRYQASVQFLNSRLSGLMRAIRGE
ncbi:MAG: flagellar basal body rod protein FlgB [Pseudomonadales bacterium]